MEDLIDKVREIKSLTSYIKTMERLKDWEEVNRAKRELFELIEKL